jgi:SPW repeat
MRFIPTRVHGVIDYLWGIALIASPWLFGFAIGGAAQWVAIVFGAGAILYSLVTVYELGALRIIPMSLHLTLDGIAGAVLAASPWLFGFSREVVWPHLLFGLFSVVASLISRTDPDLGARRAQTVRG